MESSLDELLLNPDVRIEDIEKISKFFKGSSKLMDIYYNRMLRAVVDPNTAPKIVNDIVASMVKTGYGDKVDHSSTDGTMTPTVIIGGSYARKPQFRVDNTSTTDGVAGISI
jgi:hypothetical protein